MRGLCTLLGGCRGFTLVELLVATGILVVVMSILGPALSLALRTDEGIRNDGLAINELWKGIVWFADDVQAAKSTDLEDGAPAASSVTLTWTDQFQGPDVNHTSSYAVVGDELVRTFNSQSHTVARRVVSASFSRAGRAVTIQVQVTAKDGATRTLSLASLMRPAP